MQKLFARFVKDESGATAIEYGLIAALIAVAIIGAARALGTQIAATFGDVSGAMATAAPAGP
jgi:pilus assembly protein Flp/PilA